LPCRYSNTTNRSQTPICANSDALTEADGRQRFSAAFIQASSPTGGASKAWFVWRAATGFTPGGVGGKALAMMGMPGMPFPTGATIQCCASSWRLTARG